MIGDEQLIRQYAGERSEPAFAELVRRHLKMVYAAALRQVNGDTCMAEDVAQSVFTDLARKAEKLQHHGSIAGWLYASTRFTAANAVRGETRRRTREQEVVAMNEINAREPGGWNELRPMIDEALGELGETDREAIVLRYFESYEFALVGAALGVSENAARMRVDRALEKLRTVLQKRGLATTGAALGGLLVESSASAVPAQLAAHITGAALAQAVTTTTGSAASILKLLIMKKITLVATGVLAVSLATVVVVKNLPKPPPPTAAAGVDDWMKDEPGVKKFRAMHNFDSLGPDHTVIMGGWTLGAGTRLVVFITPTMIDASGNRVAPPFSAQTQIQIDSKFVSVPEQALVKLGLQTLLTGKNESQEALICSDSQFRSYISAIQNSDGADVLSAPRVTTSLGTQAKVSVQDTKVIAGKNQALGPSLDVLPKLSSDGVSVDLLAIAQFVEAVPGPF